MKEEGGGGIEISTAGHLSQNVPESKREGNRMGTRNMGQPGINKKHKPDPRRE